MYRKIINFLLGKLGYEFGLYSRPQDVGYDGWLRTPNKIIFFGQQITVIERG